MREIQGGNPIGKALVYQIGGSQTWAQTGYRGFRRLNLDDHPQKLHFSEYGNCCNFVNNGPILMIFFLFFLLDLELTGSDQKPHLWLL